METLTPKETAALQSFKEKVQDVIDSFEDEYFKHDLNLMRYLRARDLNVTKAEELLRKNIKWREETKVHELLKKPVSEDMLNRFPAYATGYDKDGAFVQISPFGIHDIKQALDDGKKEELWEFMLQGFERAVEIMKQKTKQSGKYVYQTFFIADAEEMSLLKLMRSDVLNFQKELTLTAEDNYPEFLKINFVVNAPTVFEVLFNVIKPFISKHMLSKIRICGSNGATWRQQLRDLIEPDNLPSKYGGSNTSAVYYHPDHGIDLKPKLVTLEESEMVTETVATGQKFTVKVQVSEGSSRLVWNFKTVDYDIGFSLHMDQNSSQNGESEQDQKNIFEVEKCDSHIVLQKGVLEKPQPGDYVFSFDNSYSKLRAKQLSYVVKVFSEAK